MECCNQQQIAFEWLFMGFVPKPVARQQRSETAPKKRDLQQTGFRDTGQILSGGVFVMPEH